MECDFHSTPNKLSVIMQTLRKGINLSTFVFQIVCPGCNCNISTKLGVIIASFDSILSSQTKLEVPVPS